MGRLVEVMRKLITTIINDRIQQYITLNNYLHLFCFMSGLVTTIKEENIDHKLVTLKQPPLNRFIWIQGRLIMPWIRERW